jgi:hypothetical protein
MICKNKTIRRAKGPSTIKERTKDDMTKDKKKRSATEDSQRMSKGTRPTNKEKLPQGVTVPA